MISSLNRSIKMKSRAFRSKLVDRHLRIGVPYQIRALRIARGWSQDDLARTTGMKPSAISRAESLAYGGHSLATLKRIAAAFDVALVVRFAPFTELLRWESTLSSEMIAPPSYEQELKLSSSPASSTASISDATRQVSTRAISNARSLTVFIDESFSPPVALSSVTTHAQEVTYVH